MTPEQAAEIAAFVKFLVTAGAIPFMLLFGIPYLISLGYVIYLALRALFEEIRLIGKTWQ